MSAPPASAPTASRAAGPQPDLRHAALESRRRLLQRWALAIGALAFLAWIYSGGFFLYSALVVGALLSLSVVLASLSVLGLEIDRSLSATEILLGDTVDARIELRNRKEWPALWLFWRDQLSPGLDVEGASCSAASLAGGASAKLGYRLHSLRRGLFRIGPAVVEASGPFGLVHRYLIDREPLFLTVLPRTVDLGAGWPLGHRPIHEVPRRRSLFEDPSRFLGVRDYRPGDSRRRIHWRATARTGSLQVKTFEPAVLEGVLLAIEMGEDAYPDDETLPETGNRLEELAVTTAASLADFVLRGGQSVGLLSNGADRAELYAGDWRGGTFRRLGDALAASRPERKLTAYRPLEVPPGKGAWQVQRLRTALARLTPARSPALPRVLHAELPHLPRSLVLALITPRVDGAVAGIVGEARRSGLDVAVLRIDSQARGPARRRAASLPLGVPVYSIAGEADLATLGGQRL